MFTITGYYEYKPTDKVQVMIQQQVSACDSDTLDTLWEALAQKIKHKIKLIIISFRIIAGNTKLVPVEIIAVM